MPPRKVTLFLREAECKAVRAALAPDGALADIVIERPLPAAVLATDAASYQLEGRMVFLSLYSELAKEDGRYPEIEVAKGHWTELLGRLRDRGVRAFLLNVFRHVPEPRVDAPLQDPTGLRERIRRLNRMGEDLASRGEAVLVDVDRALSSAGGRQLEADFSWSQGAGLARAVAAAAGAVAEAVSSVFG